MLAVLVALIAGAQFVVEGDVACPAPAEVSRALTELSPRGGTDNGAEVARIAVEGRAIRVTLVSSNGEVLAEKRLPRATSCKTAAESVAVVLAAWQAELHPDIALSVQVPTRQASPAPQPATPPAVVIASPAIQERRNLIVTSLGAGVLASYQASTIAPALTIDFRLLWPNRWGARLGGILVDDHAATFGPGTASWRRAAMSAGAFRRLSWRRLQADVGIDLVAARVSVEGEGYSIARSSSALDVGGQTGARLALVLGRFRPWIEVAGTAWLRPQHLEVTGVAGQAKLPVWEALAGGGLSVDWGP